MKATNTAEAGSHGNQGGRDKEQIKQWTKREQEGETSMKSKEK